MVVNLAERIETIFESYRNDAPYIGRETYHQLRPLLLERGFELKQEGRQIISGSPMFYGAVHVRGFQELFIEADLLTLEPGFTYIYGTSFGRINPTLQDRLAIKVDLDKDETKRCTHIGTGIGLGISALYTALGGFSEAAVIPPLVIGFFGFKIGQERQKQLEMAGQLKHRSYQNMISKVRSKTGINALEAALK